MLVAGTGSVMDEGTVHVMDSGRGSVWKPDFVVVLVLFVGDVAQFEQSVEQPQHSSVDLDWEQSVESSVVVVQAIAD